ncbi:unnamed protein product [Meloidogyne enterolobii]|uniref:Uncharacterized protein n=1 Tax=Meloidogyne enterolobii TaxID=390850 RepID=A0ACB0YVQ9_MELEN
MVMRVMEVLTNGSTCAASNIAKAFIVGSGNINGGNGGSYDFLGFGTLLYQQDTISESCYPEGLTARVNGTKVELNWWGPVYAINYSVDSTFYNN